MNTNKSEALYQESKNYFPGGVNSPVRAFRSVGGTPNFMVRGDGCRIWDADGNEFIDFCCSWGPLILGHNNPKVRKSVEENIQNGLSFGTPTVQENQLAKCIIENHPFLEKIRFVSSGTEAVMSAVRLARAATGKNKFIKFEGCYHGHADHFLVKAGSGLITFGNASSAGVPASFVEDTIVLPLNNLEALKQAFEQFGADIAAILIEPIPANNGLLLQKMSYLKALRNICDEYNSLLIFDEVISGFRLGFGGAGELYNIRPDIITFGKIVGGGMPVGAYGSTKEIMQNVSPDGAMYQGGTLSGNPISMAAGLAQVEQLLDKNFYKHLSKKTSEFVKSIRLFVKENNYPVRVKSAGSLFWIAFSEPKSIRSADDIDAKSMELFGKFYHSLLQKGIYFGPSGYEVGFISSAHSEEDLKIAAIKICESLKSIFD